MNNRVSKKITLLGFNTNPIYFNILRIILTVLIFSSFTIIFGNYFVSLIVSILFYEFFEYFLLDNFIKRRKEIMEKEAELFFDMMLLSLEKNKNIVKALESVCECYKDSMISMEFNKFINEIKIGKSFDEAIGSLFSRIPSKYIRNIINCIKEYHRTGINIKNDVLYQINLIMEKYDRKEIERKKLVPIKCAFFCIFFIVVILILFILYNGYV